jgi:hypothetical protein
MSMTQARRKPLFEASAYVPVPLADLIPRLVRLEAGPVNPTTAPILAGSGSGVEDRAGWTISGGPDVFDVHANGVHMLQMDIDRDRHTIGMQGHWWYRGEYALVAEPPGTRLVHRVYNVAERGRWAVPLANRMFAGYREKTQQAVDAMAASLTP